MLEHVGGKRSWCYRVRDVVLPRESYAPVSMPPLDSPPGGGGRQRSRAHASSICIATRAAAKESSALTFHIASQDMGGRAQECQHLLIPVCPFRQFSQMHITLTPPSFDRVFAGDIPAASQASPAAAEVAK
jgi:hypothetical protein